MNRSANNKTEKIKKRRTAAKKKAGRRKSAAKRRRSGTYLEYIWIAGSIVILILGIFIYRSRADATNESRALVSSEVSEYRPIIKKYARTYGIEEFTDIIEAVMQQESAGHGDDVMQSSECIYNEEYENVPGGIQDPEYSIDAGVHYLADCIEIAGCRGPDDTENLKLALQGYNFGSNYIYWTLENGESYSEEGALEFSEMMKEEMGWSSYGDPLYPQHVLRYYRSE
jgi:soluble lytic murein transglycosylase-like protein